MSGFWDVAKTVLGAMSPPKAESQAQTLSPEQQKYLNQNSGGFLKTLSSVPMPVWVGLAGVFIYLAVRPRKTK